MRRWIGFMLSALLTLTVSTANAGPYSDTIGLFKNAGASATFFGNCYGYAVFPSIGQGGSWSEARMARDACMSMISMSGTPR